MKPLRVTFDIFRRIQCEDYVMESKFDGHRAILIVDSGSAQLYTREFNKIELTDGLRPQISALNLPDGTVLDGEIWMPEKRGSWQHSRKVHCMLTFWDLIMANGVNYGPKPLTERYALLRDVIGKGTEDISVVEQLPADATIAHQIQSAVESHRGSTIRSGFIHGVVLKRKASPRRDHATKSHEHADWLKIVFC